MPQSRMSIVWRTGTQSSRCSIADPAHRRPWGRDATSGLRLACVNFPFLEMTLTAQDEPTCIVDREAAGRRPGGPHCGLYASPDSPHFPPLATSRQRVPPRQFRGGQPLLRKEMKVPSSHRLAATKAWSAKFRGSSSTADDGEPGCAAVCASRAACALRFRTQELAQAAAIN